MPLVFSCGGLWYGKGGCSVAVESLASIVKFDFATCIRQIRQINLF